MDQQHDKHGLGYVQGDGYTIGFAPIVHGPESVECDEYRTTRHELAVLARYWLSEYYEIDLFHWEGECVGTASLKTLTYASRRLDRIATILGENTFKGLVEGVRREMGQKIGNERFEEYLRQDSVARRCRLAAESLPDE